MTNKTLLVPRRLIWDIVVTREKYYEAVLMLTTVFSLFDIFVQLEDIPRIKLMVGEYQDTLNDYEITVITLLDLLRRR